MEPTTFAMLDENSESVRMDILVVDDNPANLRLLENLLNKAGYRVRLAPSGHSALKSAQASSPNLFLLDILMPEIDGFELCRQLKADPRTSEIPVIFISALDSPADKVKAFTVGAVDYIPKPFQVEEVLVRVKNQLDLYRMRQGLEVLVSERTQELREAYQVVNQNEQRYRRLVEGLSRDYFFYVHGADGIFSYLSPSVTEILGYTSEEFKTHYREYLTDNAVNQAAEHHTELCLQGQTLPPYELEIYHQDGSVRWLEVSEVPLFDKQGQVEAVEGFAHDITARKQADAQILTLQAQLEAENLYLQEEIRVEHGFNDIIGDSPTLKTVLQQVEQVAPTQATVMIQGESGTGKELFARAIHELSSRKERPLIKVNCAALSATLLESELFGHEKGSFTGATQQRKGRFELADGGTLFLDEIGEMVPEMQVKLLRVLQEGEFERVGGSQTLQVAVRVIAATNRDLAETIRAGEFRQDLYYRLNVFPIKVPPLRNRPEDIAQLVRFYVQRFGQELGREIREIRPQLMERLQAYAWPGNVRELRNVIERAVITSNGVTLRIDESMLRQPAIYTPNAKTLAEVEHDYISKILEDCDWKIEGDGGAAHRLDLNPSTLRGRLRKLGINRSL